MAGALRMERRRVGSHQRYPTARRQFGQGVGGRQNDEASPHASSAVIVPPFSDTSVIPRVWKGC